MRSGGSGVVVKSRNSSGCLIVRKKGDVLGATASTSRKLYESKNRPNINVPLSDSGSSDESPVPPGRRLGPETIRVFNGFAAASERGGSEISRKRYRVQRIRGKILNNLLLFKFVVFCLSEQEQNLMLLDC